MLPFYKTFPFMDYYKNEEAFAKDLGMIKDMAALSMMRCLTDSVFSMRQTGLPADLSQSKAAGALSVQ